MEKFSKFIQFNEAANRSLSRVWEHSQTRSFCTMSANRGMSEFPNVKTEQELRATNHKRNASLESQISTFRSSMGAKNCSYIKVDGSYPEEQADGSKVQVYEKSFMIIIEPEFTKQMVDFAISEGKRWNQDSVLIKELGRPDAYLYGTNHAQFPGYGKELSLGKFTTNSLSQYFTKLKGNRKFTFESVQFEAPQNALGHLALSKNK